MIQSNSLTTSQMAQAADCSKQSILHIRSNQIQDSASQGDFENDYIMTTPQCCVNSVSQHLRPHSLIDHLFIMPAQKTPYRLDRNQFHHSTLVSRGFILKLSFGARYSVHITVHLPDLYSWRQPGTIVIIGIQIAPGS